MKAQRDEYNWNIPVGWKPLLCAIFGHDLYRSKAWYAAEFGCLKCGVRFEHRWDMFTSTSTADVDEA